MIYLFIIFKHFRNSKFDKNKVYSSHKHVIKKKLLTYVLMFVTLKMHLYIILTFNQLKKKS